MPWTDSEPESTTLALRGVWIFDPELGGEASVRHYPYGASNKSDALDTFGVGNFYAGRESPVFDYGEHLGEVVNVSIDVPHGSTYREDLEDLKDFAARKRTLHYRDNRMRACFGTIASFSRSDQDWGTQVSFVVTQVHRDRELISA